MRIVLEEIKKLAQEGLEKNILENNEINKTLFLNIMLKTELALDKAKDSNTNKTSSNSITNNYSNRTYERIDDKSKSQMYLVAYCFSNFEHTSLYPNLSQDRAFVVAADKLGVKKNTLKNTRDWFDGHNDSHRSGWWQAPLPDDLQRFKDIYDTKDKNEVIKEAIELLDNKKCENFGYELKNKHFHGRFLNKEEVEEYIDIVKQQSTTIAKDLITQCSKQTFKNCYEMCLREEELSIDKIVKEISKYEPSRSNFSLWIRARFIKEIFTLGLEEEALQM